MTKELFGNLKAELIYNKTFDSFDHFVNELHEHISYYNEDRIHSNDAYKTTVEFRLEAA